MADEAVGRSEPYGVRLAEPECAPPAGYSWRSPSPTGARLLAVHSSGPKVGEQDVMERDSSPASTCPVPGAASTVPAAGAKSPREDSEASRETTPPTDPQVIAGQVYGTWAKAQQGALSQDRIDTELTWAVSGVSTDELWEEVRERFNERVQEGDFLPGVDGLTYALRKTATKDAFRNIREEMEHRGVVAVLPADQDEPLWGYEIRNIAIGYTIGFLSIILAILLDVTGVAEDLSDQAQRATCDDCPRFCDVTPGTPLDKELDALDDAGEEHRDANVISCAVRVFAIQAFGPFKIPGIWMGAVGAVAFMVLLTWFSGWLHVRHKVKVNYTRKITHCTGYVANVVVRFVVGSGEEIETIASLILTSAVILMLFHLFLLKPFRKRFGLCRTMMAGIDRPQDRPYTLRWNTTQNAAYFIVFIPLTYALIAQDKYQLMLIPVLVIGFGDGLAEPVGIRWGKHKYTARAIWYHGRCCAGQFTRSLEGSAVVFLATCVSVAGCWKWWDSGAQFGTAMGVLPIALTVGEAFGPHSWDNPFLLGVGGVLIIVIVAFVP
eukprot:TRINITY_DN1275_c0_g1_i3.p1 TRINITY_DN1275_c0_g1~~TRINITY_DN1275_c0_g1_i3.p1  ORF type:complete len:580 (+),score=144.27 TRINITY_DN1275_c0_g1_i3:91-1740(+)